MKCVYVAHGFNINNANNIINWIYNTKLLLCMKILDKFLFHLLEEQFLTNNFVFQIILCY